MAEQIADVTPGPSWPAANWLNQGGALIAHDPALGQRFIGEGIKRLPELGLAWFNLGLALHQRKRIPAAIRAYRQALRCQDAPRNEAFNNLAQDLLLNGQFQEGWKLYEHRLQRQPVERYSSYLQNFGQPWQGFEDPRPCEALILVAEQGFGDTLQFCRLIPTLQSLGLRTNFVCQEPLAGLLRHGSRIGTISLMLGNHAPHTRWCPLLSLPQRLNLNAGTIPTPEGYLQPCARRINAWAQQLQRTPGKRLIALHWQGNPKFERKLYSKGRSMPFEAWLGLRDLKNVEFLSIQKGAGAEQRRDDAGLAFVAGQQAFDASFNFEDTAAALANCDLLLTADSSVAHLAGAMGLPTWLALSHVPEWRWGLDGRHTPWYSSVRLFRQPRPGAWDAVVEAMGQALQNGGPA